MDIATLRGIRQGDYLDETGLKIDAAAIRALRTDREAEVGESKFAPLRDALHGLPRHAAKKLDFDADVVEIGTASELSAKDGEALDQAITAFIPWKKGPFRLFGRDIDAEWRSDWKWSRIAPELRSLKDQRIADIGCNNGYFMYRMLAGAPKLVIGFEPEARHWLNFQMLQRFAQRDELHFEMLGVEHLGLYPGFFDRIFCLGILYHHTDPVGLLRMMHRALAPGGQLIVECQGIPGEEPVALVPRGRYANARGVWWLPTRACLVHWLLRSHFRNPHCFFDEALSIDEQRRTPHAPIDSLRDFLDPKDFSRTIEGYPAPRRIYLTADK